MHRPINRSFLIALFSVSLGVVAHAPARGASRLPPLASPRVHPEATTLFAHLARTGETFPVFRRNETFERTGRLPVIVRYISEPDARSRHALLKSGVAFEGNEPTASGAWLATVTEAGLHVLASDTNVARVSVDMFRSGPRPLERSLEETRADVAKRAAIAKDGQRLDGKGTLIADIDSALYIHHPAFFRADGGAFAWVDVDADGKLTPGKDGVDLDASGTIEPGEVLRELRSIAITRAGGDVIGEHSSFEPDLDYLYLDTNGNGKRDHGEGFNESTPAYGEPLFVFDDANHDRATQPSERVIQLKTSKIKALHAETKTFTRGTTGASALVKYPADTDPTLSLDMGHATGVTGILVGGQPGISRRVGIAPEADLIVHETTGARGMASAVQWAIDQKANVILTEYAPYTNVSLDGSSEEETILDAANDKGILTVSPAGNLASGRKHRTITLQPGAQKIDIATSSLIHFAGVTIHHKGPARKLTLSWKTPKGEVIDLPDSAPDGIPTGANTAFYVFGQTTPRGTHERTLAYVGPDGLPKGRYELSVTLDPGAPLEVDMYASDDMNAWTGGFAFNQNTATRTICNPATSDKTISVAAYVLHDEEPYNPAGSKGELAIYSSRGPTLGGAAGIEIAAPDNPLSAAPPSEGVDGVVWEPFGGTSGAGPHVAAAIALLVQAFPNERATALKKRLLESTSPFTGDEDAVGKGKLDIARALGAKIASGTPPTPTIEVVPLAVGDTETKLRVVAQDDEPETGLTARWDLDYDGTFDTEWLPLGEQAISLTEAEVGTKISVKVEVRDSQGNLNGATSIVEIVAPPEAKAAPEAPAAADVGCGCRVVGGPSLFGERTRASSSIAGALAFGLACLVRFRRRARQ